MLIQLKLTRTYTIHRRTINYHYWLRGTSTGTGYRLFMPIRGNTYGSEGPEGEGPGGDA